MIPSLSPSFRSVTNYKARLIERVGNQYPGMRDDLRNIKLPWYYIRNAEGEGSGAVENGETEIFIYDEIGGSFGVSAAEFVEDLNAITSERVTVRINSPGGSVFDSIAIYNALMQHSAHVLTRVDALAASGASIVAMAGDEIEMMPGSQMMIHDALGAEMGNAAAMREMAKFLDNQSDNIATVYAYKAGGDPSEWRGLMLKETWMFAQEAVDMGLADRVYQRPTLENPAAAEDIPDEEMPAEPEEGEESEDEVSEDEAVNALMNYRHRLSNRGYKYLGRQKAKAPVTNAQPRFVSNSEKALSDAELDAFARSFQKILGK